MGNTAFADQKLKLWKLEPWFSIKKSNWTWKAYHLQTYKHTNKY